MYKKKKKYSQKYFVRSRNTHLIVKKFTSQNFKTFTKNTIGENAHCGNYKNLLSQIFGKNFVKVTFLLLTNWVRSNYSKGYSGRRSKFL